MIHNEPPQSDLYDPVIVTDGEKLIDITRITEHDIDVISVVRMIAAQTRYNGAFGFYSVAQHTVVGYWMAQEEFGDDTAKRFLLHDFAEYLIGDIIHPVKVHFSKVDRFEKIIMKAVAKKFGVKGPILDRNVKIVDSRMFATEWFAFAKEKPELAKPVLPSIPQKPSEFWAQYLENRWLPMQAADNLLHCIRKEFPGVLKSEGIENYEF